MWTVASIYKMGAKSFFGKSWSWINLTQTCLYAASLAAYFVSLVQVSMYMYVVTYEYRALSTIFETTNKTGTYKLIEMSHRL